jgi:hypothetical protein
MINSRSYFEGREKNQIYENIFLVKQQVRFFSVSGFND